MRYLRVTRAEIGDQLQSSVDEAAVMGIVDYTEHPLGKGNLTSNGIQYSTPAYAQTGTTNYTVESVTIDPDCDGDVMEFEFGLTAAFKATASTTATIGYQWQARNNGGTWVGLHATQVIAAAIGTTYTSEPTWSGKFLGTTNLNRVPLDVQLVFACGENTEGYAKTKNSSYIKVLYKAD